MKGNEFFIADWKTFRVHFVNNLSGLTTETSRVFQPCTIRFFRFIPLFATFWKTLPARNRCVVEPSAYLKKNMQMLVSFGDGEKAAGRRALRDLWGFCALCNNSCLSKYFAERTDPTHFRDACRLLDAPVSVGSVHDARLWQEDT